MNKIAFCIPVMARLDDIKETLIHNLEVMSKFKGQAKIYIICFDDNNELELWLNENIDLSSKLDIINYIKYEPLEYWHFSWAKNSFKDIITEEYYSSLDGDNFLSVEEVEQILSIINSGNDVLFHGFSGIWGDGTSGRITIPTNLFKKYGYLNEIYPRQADELGLIANIVSNEKDISYYSFSNVNIFEISNRLKQWVEKNDIKIKNIQVEKLKQPKAINPKTSNYVNEDKTLKIFQEFNSLYTYAKITKNEKIVSWYKKQIDEILFNIDTNLAEKLLNKTFSFKRSTKLSSETTLYAVVQNDYIFLNKWIEHYKKIGIKRFVIIDDNSDKDLSEYFSNIHEVYVYKPKIGNFKLCKIFWINFLLKTFQEKNSWFLTVDSDEFLDIIDYENIDKLIDNLEKNDKKFLSAILVDMLPDSNLDLKTIDHANFEKSYNYVYSRPINNGEKYSSVQSVKWAFDNYWPLSYCYDIRWRLFGTFDSLRKYPLVKYNDSILLNQGFHSLRIQDKEVSPKWTYEDKKFILPIKHFKFVNFFTKKVNDKNFDEYHERTSKNLKIISSQNLDDLKNELKFSPFVNEYKTENFKRNVHEIYKTYL